MQEGKHHLEVMVWELCPFRNRCVAGDYGDPEICPTDYMTCSMYWKYRNIEADQNVQLGTLKEK